MNTISVPTEDVSRLREDFVRGEIPSIQLYHLWRLPSDARFFAKTIEGFFIAASPNLLRIIGLDREEDIVGRTDFDFYSRKKAESFRKDDWQVCSSGKPFPGIIEIIPDRKDASDWYITDKIPILSRGGRIVGVMGMSRKFAQRDPEGNACPGVAKAMRHMKAHFSEDLSIQGLADLAHLSVRQFRRSFRSCFDLAPHEYLIRIRVQAACDLLSTGHQSVSRVALTLGFGDTTHFIRHFKQIMGMTPLQYRLRRRP
jgi:AraC-like DNA-binding protein